MSERISVTEYYEGFEGLSVDEDAKSRAALKEAWDIRKFEIELYWKRAGYFWTFIGAAFAGYFLVYKEGAVANSDVLFVINCLGLVFSIAWYFAIRGSKFWQLNWEKHVDWLENDVTGPLYKTFLDHADFPFRSLIGPYRFSVSKINTILSLFVVFVWFFLALHLISTVFGLVEPVRGTNMVILIFATGFFVGLLGRKGRSAESEVQQYGFRRRLSPKPISGLRQYAGESQRLDDGMVVKIPASFADATELTPGTLVNLSTEGGRLVISPVDEPEYTLKGLLSQVTDENIHPEVDWGPSVGKEAW
jgi:antitoxin component of MazEF toxin-antitoxin module